jgi:transposase
MMRLTEQQWTLLQPVFDPPAPSPTRGRPSLDPRPILEGILWKFSRNAAWYNMPTAYPSRQTCYRAYRRWSREGRIAQVIGLLYTDLLERGEFDFRRALQEGKIIFTPRAKDYLVQFPAEMRDAWQPATAMIFIGLAVKKFKTNRTLTIAF